MLINMQIKATSHEEQVDQVWNKYNLRLNSYKHLCMDFWQNIGEILPSFSSTTKPSKLKHIPLTGQRKF